MPGATTEAGKVKRVSAEQVEKTMILVTARLQNGQPVVEVEKKPVGLEELTDFLRQTVANTKKTTLLVDAAKEVDYGVVMAIMDSARGAGIAKTNWVHPPATK